MRILLGSLGVFGIILSGEVKHKAYSISGWSYSAGVRYKAYSVSGRVEYKAYYPVKHSNSITIFGRKVKIRAYSRVLSRKTLRRRITIKRILLSSGI